MPIAVTNLDKGNTLTQATSYLTNSITPAANALIIVSVESLVLGTNPNIPTITGDGITWVQVNTEFDGSQIRITVFRGMSASPTAGALTISFGAQTQHDINWSVEQATGVDITGTNGSGAVVQSVIATAASTTPSATLAALASVQNVAYGAVAGDAGSPNFVKGTNFTELSNQTNSSSGMATEYGLNQTLVNWTSSNITWAIVALEIRVFPDSGLLASDI